MIKLTDRLQCLADQIKPNETVADIGTDHGFLPIYLYESGISPRVILTDVSAGSLEKARRNVAMAAPAAAGSAAISDHTVTGADLSARSSVRSVFDLRLGDGIQVLAPAEADCVVMAGMGGILMSEIMAADPVKSRSFGKWVLQPRSGQGELRYWLLTNGFGIVREHLVREGKFICEVLVAAPDPAAAGSALIAGKDSGAGRGGAGGTAARKAAAGDFVSRRIPGRGPRDIEYQVPPWIRTAGALADEFVARRLAAEERVLAQLANSKKDETAKKQRIQERINYLNALLEEK